MTQPVRVVHYVNQFFGGIGGEDKAHTPLEVREGNARARAIYLRRGFEQVGVRRGYYPAPHGRREDAIVMSLVLQPRMDGAM